MFARIFNVIILINYSINNFNRAFRKYLTHFSRHTDRRHLLVKMYTHTESRAGCMAEEMILKEIINIEIFLKIQKTFLFFNTYSILLLGKFRKHQNLITPSKI